MSAMDNEGLSLRYRSIFISDVRLGTRGCQAELLLDFIRRHSCDRLYLVGDILHGGAEGRLEILEWAKLRSWSMIKRARHIPEGELTEPLTA